MSAKWIWFSIVAVVGLVLDQVTKAWIRANIEYRDVGIEVIDGYFDIVHAQNPGAALGILGDVPGARYIFVLFTVVATVVIVNMQRQLKSGEKFLPVVLGLILSGALGNAVDRIINEGGRVTDFLRFHTDGNPELRRWLADSMLGMSEYPSFNVADISLVVGVLLFIIHYLFLEEKEEAQAKPPADPAA
ncbi:MAG: signal peptidase II [Myxococcota bacterium]